jgi:hypothetical protein
VPSESITAVPSSIPLVSPPLIAAAVLRVAMRVLNSAGSMRQLSDGLADAFAPFMTTAARLCASNVASDAGF